MCKGFLPLILTYVYDFLFIINLSFQKATGEALSSLHPSLVKAKISFLPFLIFCLTQNASSSLVKSGSNQMGDIHFSVLNTL